MNKIKIGSIIATKRKQKGLTQEELAEYIGVSKPAVSKWESGRSYPDIILLPALAAYFNVSVDELLGYESQMTREDVRKLYTRLANAFAVEPFEQVHAECFEYITKYYSCWNLLFSMGVLLVNHAPLAGTPAKSEAIYQEAIKLFQRIENDSGETILARLSLQMQAACHIAMAQPTMAIDLLDEIVELPISSKVLLARAYQMKGDQAEAKGLLQGYIYQNIIGILGACPDLMMLSAELPEKTASCYNNMMELGRIFGVEEMHPALYFPIHSTAAQLFIRQNKKEKALNALEAYVDLVSNQDLFPLKLKGNDFFDALDSFFDSSELGRAAPRNDEVIKQSIKDLILNNPVFEQLQAEERYQHLVKKLKEF